MNVVEYYMFGKIIVNGQTYTKDLIIFPDYIQSNWWRKEGHTLHLEDLTEVFNRKPEILVVGIGAQGVMKISEEIKEEIKRKGLELIIAKTGQAVEEYNKLVKDNKNVAAALHLTC
ncbi:MAG: Mth938-like domain-containing protein [Candidatus Heimdallarchaeaceae archaeon]